jgi:hypothetical protein
MWKKYGRAGQAADNNTTHAHCSLETLGYKHTLRICDTYCFSTATMIARMRLYVTLYDSASLIVSTERRTIGETAARPPVVVYPVCNYALGAQGALHATTDHHIQLFPGTTYNGSAGARFLRCVFLDRWDSGVVD